ncbi:hypothetical protein ACFL6X_05460 [Candidatus Latescibacterota bacterium]
MADHILEEGAFPIVGWAGPGGEMIREEVMAGMAEAGFTVSHSGAGSELAAVRRALDVAADAGVRLLLVHPSYHVGDEYELTEERRQQIAELVAAVGEHPGLYGYHLRDEPRFHVLPRLAEVSAFIRSLDPYHLIYINHFPPIRGFGAPTIEWFWGEYIRLCEPTMLSYDHYPVQVGTSEEVARDSDLPNVFERHKIVVKSDFFEALDLLRALSSHHGIPFWAFTCAVRHGAYPPPTEGHMRFQLFNDLIYGARGLQYFTYAHDQAMVRADGSTTETWEMARRINSEIHTLAPLLRRLTNIGVCHHGPLWSGTRSLPRSDEPLSVAVEGDSVAVGFFRRDDGLPYVMVANTNPCDWARVTLKVKVEDERLHHVDPRDGVIRELWPPNPGAQLVGLAPGEGRLFQIGGEGEGKNF